MINERKLTLLMDGLGFKEKLLGTAYIREGVRIMDEDPSSRMMKEVYPAIAKAASINQGCTIKPHQVERCMRISIQAATQSPGWGSTWRGIGGWGNPENSEVLRRLARESADED